MGQKPWEFQHLANLTFSGHTLGFSLFSLLHSPSLMVLPAYWHSWNPSQVLLMSHPDCGDFLPAPLHLLILPRSPLQRPDAFSAPQHLGVHFCPASSLWDGFLRVSAPLCWVTPVSWGFLSCSPVMSSGWFTVATPGDDRPFTGGHGPETPVVASLLCGLISSSQVAGTV